MPSALQTITDDESTHLLEHLKNPPCTRHTPHSAHRNYTMALLMLDAGLRCGEVVKLTRNCLMFAGEFCDKVAVPADISKNKQERSIPTTDRLQRAIKKMDILYWTHDAQMLKEPAVYSHDRLQHLTPRQLQRIIKDAAIASIGRPIHPHILRHTFATKLMRKTNIRIVQQLLGHKSIQSTQVYTHPNDQDLKTAIDSLNGDSTESPTTPKGG